MKKLFCETNKYKILATIRYLGDGLFYPFFALYLRSREMTESHIGFILSISPLLAILMNPIYSKICKRPKDTKNVLMIITILEGLCIASIAYLKDFYVISAITLLMAIFGACHYGLMDALTALYADQAKINYSSIRLFGSAAYIVATTVGGLICNTSFQLSFILSGVLFVLSGLIYHILTPMVAKENIDEAQIEEKEEVPFSIVLKNKELWFFGLVYMLLLGTTKITDNFFSVYLESRGLGAKEYGLIYSYFVLFEVISLIAFDKLLKKNANTYLWFFISCICLLTRTFVNYLYLPIIVVVLITCLRGFRYAIILHITYAKAIDIVGEKASTKAIMFLTLLYSIFVFAFNNIGGLVIEEYSYKTFYMMGIILVLFTMLLIVIKLIVDKKRVRI